VFAKPPSFPRRKKVVSDAVKKNIPVLHLNLLKRVIIIRNFEFS